MPGALTAGGPDRRIGRRGFIGGAAALTAGGVVLRDTRFAHAQALPRGGSPFALGVASGDPRADAVVLWTRLVRDPLDAAAMPRRPIPVQWEVAEDDRFRRVVRAGTAWAQPRLAHSVHVDVRGLRPDRDYAYRFRVGRRLSAIGRTRTTPAPWASPYRWRMGLVNCQDWQNGYWGAFRGLAAEDLDVVVHVGDYIYEYDPRSAYPDRQHNPPQRLGLDQLRTLADFRDRHALYKTDPALQAAHAQFPWILTWDDHEVENNYATFEDEVDDTGARRQTPAQFAVERANAYQAYWEHMPIRPRVVPGSPLYRIYRGFEVGDLLQLHVLDTRQYRTDQPGDYPNDFGPPQAGLANTAGTMTGAEQEAWLRRRLRRSDAVWDVIAQQTLLTRLRFPNPTGGPPPLIANLDQWDGYAPQRARLLGALRELRVANPVVLTGDIHSTWLSDLPVDPEDPTSRVVATEMCATSISSDFPIAFDPVLKQVNPALNPQVRYFDGSRRGYLVHDVRRDSWTTSVRNVSSIAVRDAPMLPTTVRVAVEAGRPGVVPA